MNVVYTHRQEALKEIEGTIAEIGSMYTKLTNIINEHEDLTQRSTCFSLFICSSSSRAEWNENEWFRIDLQLENTLQNVQLGEKVRFCVYVSHRTDIVFVLFSASVYCVVLLNDERSFNSWRNRRREISGSFSKSSRFFFSSLSSGPFSDDHAHMSCVTCWHVIVRVNVDLNIIVLFEKIDCLRATQCTWVTKHVTPNIKPWHGSNGTFLCYYGAIITLKPYSWLIQPNIKENTCAAGLRIGFAVD